MKKAHESDHRRLRVSALTQWLNMLGIYALLLALFLAGMCISPKFATPENLLNVLRNVTLLGIVALGVAFITYSRHYVDLSIPSMMALSGFVAISALPLGFVPSLLCGLLAGIVVGAINGYMIGYWRVNPIIWTLAMVFMLDGVLRWAYGGNQIYPDNGTPAGAAFLQLSQIVVFKFLPLPTLLLLVLVVVLHWLMKHTRFGAQVQLTGSANEVARLSGVPVAQVIWLTFILSAFTTALAGILLTSMNKQGTFETGQGYDFNSVTAVVLGGISLAGGRGKLLGVLGGVLVIGVLLNLMTLLGLGSFLQLVVKGLVFIAVVGLTSWFGRRSGRSNV